MVLVILSVSAVSYALVLLMVNPGLEALRGQAHTNQLGVSWVLTAFLLASAVLTPMLGRPGDQVGKRRTLVAVLLYGRQCDRGATSLPVLVVGRPAARRGRRHPAAGLRDVARVPPRPAD
jgi:MFS family permease